MHRVIAGSFDTWCIRLKGTVPTENNPRKSFIVHRKSKIGNYFKLVYFYDPNLDSMLDTSAENVTYTRSFRQIPNEVYTIGFYIDEFIVNDKRIFKFSYN